MIMPRYIYKNRNNQSLLLANLSHQRFVQRRLYSATLTPHEDLFTTHLQTQINQQLSILPSHLPVLYDPHHRNRLLVRSYLEAMLLGLGQTPRTSNLKKMLLTSYDPNELNPFITVKLHADNILIIPKNMLNNPDISILRRYRERLNSLSLSLEILPYLSLNYVVVCRQ